MSSVDTSVPSDMQLAPPHPFREFWDYFTANKGAVVGIAVIVLMLLLALFADVIAPHSPYVTDSSIALAPVTTSN